MKEPQRNQLNWLHVYYVCRYFICLNMDLIMQTGAKQSEFRAGGSFWRGGGWEVGGKGWLAIIWTYGMSSRTQLLPSFEIYPVWKAHTHRTSISIEPHLSPQKASPIFDLQQKCISASLIGTNTLDSSWRTLAIDLTVFCNLLCGGEATRWHDSSRIAVSRCQKLLSSISHHRLAPWLALTKCMISSPPHIREWNFEDEALGSHNRKKKL